MAEPRSIATDSQIHKKKKSSHLAGPPATFSISIIKKVFITTRNNVNLILLTYVKLYIFKGKK